MKRYSIFLQVVVVLIGIGALAFLIWEPTVEGRNVNATLYEIYFTDPFLAYAYIASIPFFVALYKAFKVLGYTRQDMAFRVESIKALRVIKYCAMSMIGFVAGGEIWIMLSESDDRTGGFFMGMLITLGAVAMAYAAVRFENRLREKSHEGV